MAGPCVWDIEVSEECCPQWATYTDENKTKALTAATYLLWAATGRRYGICNIVTRPCGLDRKCGNCGSFEFGAGWMRPYILDGMWRNCLCGCACDCKPHCQIRLPGPVQAVTEVLLDGIIISPTAWRVDDYQWLVRTDGECWPECQDYDVDVPADNTLQVSYGRGDVVPQALLDAAATLACEFGKACAQDKSCALPGRLQTLTRQGVTASMVDISTVLRSGLTGITSIDQIIMADNPGGLKARPFFHSFDTAPRVRTVTQA